MCNQQRLRPAYAQSGPSLCYSLLYSMTVKLLTQHNLVFLSLKWGCSGLSESTLVKMPHCWKSHVAAQIISADDKAEDICCVWHFKGAAVVHSREQITKTLARLRGYVCWYVAFVASAVGLRQSPRDVAHICKRVNLDSATPLARFPCRLLTPYNRLFWRQITVPLGVYKEWVGEDFFVFHKQWANLWTHLLLMEKVSLQQQSEFASRPNKTFVSSSKIMFEEKMHKNSFLFHPYVYETNHIIVTYSLLNYNQNCSMLE